MYPGGSTVREQRAVARILIADANQLLADACKSLLEPEFSVVGIVTDGRHLADAVAELRPDIIILDIYMIRLNRLDSDSRSKRKTPEIKLVFRTMTLAADKATEAFRGDASGHVLERSAEDELLLAVRKVNLDEAHISPRIASDTDILPLNKREPSIRRKEDHKETNRDPTTSRRGLVDEASSRCHRRKTRHGRLSQVSNDGDTEYQNQR